MLMRLCLCTQRVIQTDYERVFSCTWTPGPIWCGGGRGRRPPWWREGRRERRRRSRCCCDCTRPTGRRWSRPGPCRTTWRVASRWARDPDTRPATRVAPPDRGSCSGCLAGRSAPVDEGNHQTAMLRRPFGGLAHLVFLMFSHLFAPTNRLNNVFLMLEAKNGITKPMIIWQDLIKRRFIFKRNISIDLWRKRKKMVGNLIVDIEPFLVWLILCEMLSAS